MSNWIACQKGDLTKTRVDPEIGTPEEDILAWETLNYDHVLNHGLHRSQVRYLQLQKTLMLARLEYVVTEDRFLLNKIDDILKTIQDEFPEDKKEINYTESFVTLSKWMHHKQSPENTFVKEFFTMIEMYNKEIAAKTQKPE
jgi:hypothetical protein